MTKKKTETELGPFEARVKEELAEFVAAETDEPGPHEALASQTSIINAAIRHQQAYGVQPEAPAPYFQPNVQDPSAAVANSTDTPERVASDYLNSARRQLEHVGHYETNEVVKLIDLALKMLKLCEESDEP